MNISNFDTSGLGKEGSMDKETSMKIEGRPGSGLVNK
jgi:hypothetical protein